MTESEQERHPWWLYGLAGLGFLAVLSITITALDWAWAFILWVGRLFG